MLQDPVRSSRWSPGVAASVSMLDRTSELWPGLMGQVDAVPVLVR